MAVFKCKMCGASLNIAEDASTAMCEYCGSMQTVPKVDDEKKLTLFTRANRLRASCEFDKASGIFEAIIADFPEEAEAYWGLVLCKYGIEYVDDPATGKKVPTCHRSSFENVMKDENVELAMEYADMSAKILYREEAKQIEELRKQIISVSANEAPYDIFISYKEKGFDGNRTLDSVLAQDLYDALTDKGYRVFFSRISLEDKLGTEYEPYIFAALNSAKLMLVVGTRFEHFDAVWVKNEWSRFLKLMTQDKTKHLIPCFKGIDAYDMPEEFARLQAQDLGKMGADQDILRGVEKLLPKEKAKETVALQSTSAARSPTTDSYLTRAFMFLDDGDWKKANEYCEKVLDIDAKNVWAYLGKLLAEVRVSTQGELIHSKQPFDNSPNYQKLMRFGDETLKAQLTGYIEHINNRNELARQEDIYCEATEMMAKATDEEAYIAAGKLLASIAEYEDAAALAQECLTKASGYIYTKAKKVMASAKNEAGYIEAANLFEAISEYKDAAALARSCYEKAKVAKKEAEEKAKEERIARLTQNLRDEIREKTSCFSEERSGANKAALKKVFIVFACLAVWFGLSCVANPREELNKPIALVLAGSFLFVILLVLIINHIRFKRKFNKNLNSLLGEARNKYADDEYFAAILSVDFRFRDTGLIVGVVTTTIAALAIAYFAVIAPAIEKDNNYKNAVALMETGSYEEAYNAFVAMGDYKDSAELATEVFNKAREAILPALREAEVGDYVIFGKYEQDNDESNGTEDIEWLVLAKEDNRILVISKYALAHNIFHKNLVDVVWEDSSIRNWLNGSGFMDVAFSTAEKSLIPTVTVSADKNPEYKTSPGNATQDKIFLLSVSEVCRYFASDAAMACKPTAYALAKGVKNYDDYCHWWLRTPGINGHTAAYVFPWGGVYHHGAGVNAYNDDGIAVRPAMWIELS